jgi:hypothetical protein
MSAKYVRMISGEQTRKGPVEHDYVPIIILIILLKIVPVLKHHVEQT